MVLLPEIDSPVWFYSTVFNGLLTAVFTATLNLTATLAPDNVLLIAENAVLFTVFACIEVVSTAVFSRGE